VGSGNAWKKERPERKKKAGLPRTESKQQIKLGREEEKHAPNGKVTRLVSSGEKSKMERGQFSAWIHKVCYQSLRIRKTAGVLGNKESIGKSGPIYNFILSMWGGGGGWWGGGGGGWGGGGGGGVGGCFLKHGNHAKTKKAVDPTTRAGYRYRNQ